MGTMPISAHFSPYYFIKATSDKWLHCDKTLAVELRKLLLPDTSCVSNELLDLYLLSISMLKNFSFDNFYRREFQEFNPIQTQVFSILYNTEDNVLLAATKGSGKTVCTELAILH